MHIFWALLCSVVLSVFYILHGLAYASDFHPLPKITSDKLSISSVPGIVASRDVSSQVLLRLPEKVHHLKQDPFFGTRIVMVEERTGALKSLHLPSKRLTTISPGGVGAAFFWVSDGVRLIYRKQVLRKNRIYGDLRVFDHHLKKSFSLETIQGFSGYPSFDPREGRILLIHARGMIQKRVRLPRSRLAKWQMKREEKYGSFAVTPQGMMYISPSSKSMQRLRDDGSGIQSYDISRNGRQVVWSTIRGGVYRGEDRWSTHAPTSMFVGYGKDVSWMHDDKNIVLSGARVVGDRAGGYDLRMISPSGEGVWLTQTFASHERWPLSLPTGSIIYTVENTTDLFAIPAKNVASELALLVSTRYQGGQ